MTPDLRISQKITIVGFFCLGLFFLFLGGGAIYHNKSYCFCSVDENEATEIFLKFSSKKKNAYREETYRLRGV